MPNTVKHQTHTDMREGGGGNDTCLYHNIKVEFTQQQKSTRILLLLLNAH